MHTVYKFRFKVVYKSHFYKIKDARLKRARFTNKINYKDIYSLLIDVTFVCVIKRKSLLKVVFVGTVL